MRRPGALLAVVLLMWLSACAGGGASQGRISGPTDRTQTSLPLDFAVIGDFGDGSQAENGVARSLCRWRQTHPFDLVVTVGDNIYPDGAPSRFESEFFKPYSCLLTQGVRFHAALGNHDIETADGQPEISDPRFGMPAHNYVVRTHGVRFVFADSNDINTGWLDAISVPNREIAGP